MPILWNDATDRRLMLTMLRENSGSHNWSTIADALQATGDFGDTVTGNALSKRWKKILDMDSAAFPNASSSARKTPVKRSRGQKKSAVEQNAEQEEQLDESPAKKVKCTGKAKAKGTVKAEPVDEDGVGGKMDDGQDEDAI